MQLQRISLAVDRRDRPIDFTELLWRMDTPSDAGFRMERHRIGPAGSLKDFAVDEPLLGLCVAGSACMEYGGRREAERMVVRPGQFTLLARGAQPRSISWAGVRETLYVSLPIARLEAMTESRLDGARLAILPQYGMCDPELARLVLNMYVEMRDGCPSGRLYGQSLATALASYVLARYSTQEHRAAPVRGVLNEAKASQLRDYIRAHLGRDTSLTQLAALVGLSPHYFAAVFRNTFGCTPHRYLLQERIVEAKRMLTLRDMPVCAVAQALGFADQSHFTRVFRKLTGTTPSRYQRFDT
jgi:AraC family transcriptional regulator